MMRIATSLQLTELPWCYNDRRQPVEQVSLGVDHKPRRLQSAFKNIEAGPSRTTVDCCVIRHPTVWSFLSDCQLVHKREDFATTRLHFCQMGIGLSLAFVGLLGGVMQFFAGQPAVRRMGERWAMMASVGLFLASQLFFVVASTSMVFLLGHVVMGLGGLGTPAFNAAMSRRVAPDREGEFQGAMGSLQGLSGLVGPAIFGGSFAYVTSPSALWRLTGAPFFISAALALSALVFTIQPVRKGAGVPR